MFDSHGSSQECIRTSFLIKMDVIISVLTRIFRPKGANNICDLALHLECSDSQYQTLVACVPLSTKDSKLSSTFTEFCSQSPDSS